MRWIFIVVTLVLLSVCDASTTINTYAGDNGQAAAYNGDGTVVLPLLQASVHMVSRSILRIICTSLVLWILL